ncbi:MAG: carbohydrate transporter ATP-binding protein family [Clostridia bacterium]|jgi:ABC-type sugar transport system ATPase subunit|nr:carbohydrate transporter ATP-binding protein family [Clostridia bacterium]
MPNIKLTNVTKRWGKYYAVDNLNLDIEDNSFITLLGPSGCGKTTTLRMIAGLETPTTGRITIGDKVVFDSEQGINMPPNKRRVGFLFQNYALWPNMTVYDNIAFGLSNVKEELPTYNFSYKNTMKLIEILSNPKEVIKHIEECRDKNNKIDLNKVLLKLIDTYSISTLTAKTLFSYNLHEVKATQDAANQITNDLTKKADEIRASYKAKGQELNEECAVVDRGKVIKTIRNLSKEEIDLSVRRVARIVKIGMFMDRYPAELSGGQQQRVAIARTLAPEPTVLFMDEPLSNLDAKLRLEMRYELQRLHVETGSTFVYVTHDQMEAMTLATKICLINNGILQQYAAPLDVYNKPNNLFVADFVGNPSVNFIEAKGKQQEDGSIALSILDGINATFKPSAAINLRKWFEHRNTVEDEEIEVRQKSLQDKRYVEKGNKDEAFKYHIAKVNYDEFDMQEDKVITDENFVIAVRPECVSITESGDVEGIIYGAMPTGMESTVKIRVGEFLLTGVIFGNVLYQIGTTVHIDITSDNITLYDQKSGKYIVSGSIQIM